MGVTRDDVAITIASGRAGRILACSAVACLSFMLLSPSLAYIHHLRAELWAARYAGAYGYIDHGTSIVSSPDGSTVFVAGTLGAVTVERIIVLAYSAATGELRWSWRTPAMSPRSEPIAGMDPSGSRVFIAMPQRPSDGRRSVFEILALDAATGEVLWDRHVNVEGGAPDIPQQIVATGRGRVYVAGSSEDAIALVALSRHAGRLRWTTRDEGGVGTGMFPELAVDEAHRRLFVTDAARSQCLTIAHDTRTGERLWRVPTQIAITRQGDGCHWPGGIVASTDGTRVFVPFSTDRPTSSGGMDVFAYGARSGRLLWVTRHDEPGSHPEDPTAVSMSADGRFVYVASEVAPAGTSYPGSRVAAMTAVGGNVVWENVQESMTRPRAIAIGSRGRLVMTGTTGSYSRYATVAVDMTTGAAIWRGEYLGVRSGDDDPAAMTISPDGRTVFITGRSDADIATIAYAV